MSAQRDARRIKSGRTRLRGNDPAAHGVRPAGSDPGNPAISLTAGCGRFGVPCLSPWGVRIFMLWLSFAATGRGWRHPTLTCRRPAPGRRARWLEIQEARCDRFRQSVSNGAEPETAERHMADRACGCLTVSGPHRAVGRSLQRRPKSPSTRVPKGSPLGRETAPEGLRALLGCGVGASVSRRTLAGSAGGAGGAGRAMRIANSGGRLRLCGMLTS